MLPEDSPYDEGYGDRRPPTRDVLLGQVFPDMRRWLYWEARQQTGLSSLHDDLVQEAYISMWRVIDRLEDGVDPGPFLRAVARTRMRACLSEEGTWTGQTGDQRKEQSQYAKRGGDETRQRIRDYVRDYRAEHGEDPSQNQIGRGLGMNSGNVNRHLKRMHMSADAKPIKATSLDEMVEGSGDGVLMLEAPDLLDEVALAYHYGEIHEAIAHLPTEEQKAYVLARFWGGYTDAEIAAMRETEYATVWSLWKRVQRNLSGELHHLQGVV